MRKNEQGFSVIEIFILLVVLVALGFISVKFLSARQRTVSNTSGVTNSTPNQSSVGQEVRWNTDANGNWLPTQGQPPACPAQPMLKTPVSLAKVTSILYPGQTRGGNYKPHGGFRFNDITDNKVEVFSPIDGYVFRGSRYLVSGETQYSFDIINPCGVMVRLGHLLTLSEKFQALANAFPSARAGDSRTTNISSTVNVKAGELMATRVGVTVGGSNTFFDFGVYDLRAANQAGTNQSYVQRYGMELAGHAVCWLNTWLPTNDETKINSLPAGDPASGKTSDYCK